MRSGWEAGVNAHESRYLGWWSGSSGSESNGNGNGDAHESRNFGWWSGGSGDFSEERCLSAMEVETNGI